MTVGVEILGHVGLIELRDPPHNFLTAEKVALIADALESFDANVDVRCAVVAAEGRSFSAGGDFQGGRTAGELEMTDRLYAGAARVAAVATPWIAAVQGPAVGGGLGLALAATLRVTCPEARFVPNFVKLGIHHGFGLSVTLPELVGPAKAAMVLLSGRRIKGDEATALGMADVCVEQGRVREAALELATEIATGAPLAIAAIHRTLRAGLADRLRAATTREGAEQARLSRTEDAREGMRSVEERRVGNFTGS